MSTLQIIEAIVFVGGPLVAAVVCWFALAGGR